GQKPAETLFDVLNTRAFFRSPSRNIAEFAAGEIGEKEILKASEQYSYGVDPVRDGTSVGKDMERVTLVSYSDVQTLPDLSCYVTLPGPYPAVKMALKYQQRPKVAPEFIPRTIDGKAEERLNAALAAREHESRSIAMLFEPDADVIAPEASAENTGQPQQPQQLTPAPRAADAPSASASAAGAAGTGGVEPELKTKAEEAEQLPPGISESGEV
ncbi:type IV secretion system DNA-binding domain-containing protein, partial [Enterobacter hormaechei subsp. steigerwaltii]